VGFLASGLGLVSPDAFPAMIETSEVRRWLRSSSTTAGRSRRSSGTGVVGEWGSAWWKESVTSVFLIVLTRDSSSGAATNGYPFDVRRPKTLMPAPPARLPIMVWE
jgi:hypothetical protein